MGSVLKDFQLQILPDGPQNTNYGCMAGLTRLAVDGRDIIVYSNCDSGGGRERYFRPVLTVVVHGL